MISGKSNVTTAMGMRATTFAMILAMVAGCSGGGGGDTTAPSTSLACGGAPNCIGSAGGAVTGPDGVRVVVPPDALDQPTPIGIVRSLAGAPTLLPEDKLPTGGIYEFTPHGLVFNKPVTIRMPVPPNSFPSEVFMASLGGGWQENGAIVTGAIETGLFSELQRNSFSWGMIAGNCSPVDSLPYPCVYPRGATTATATPEMAITPIPNPIRPYFNPNEDNPISWVVNGPGTVQLTIRYAAAGDCENGRVKLLRWNPATPINTPGRVQTVFEQQHVELTLTYFFLGAISYPRMVGRTVIDIASYPYLSDATNAFEYSFSCNQPSRPAWSGGEVLTFIGSMPAPSVTHTIGGTVNGLTGSGLVLQNNKGDNLTVPAPDAPFTFATAIAAGAPYSVSVFTQPSNPAQTCTVLNGSGTATGDVTTVAVSCGLPLP